MLSIFVRTIFAQSCILLIATMPCVFADGGVVLFKETATPYTITVFHSPAPLTAGISDISALVQNEITGEPVLDCSVKLVATAVQTNTSAKAWQPPCCSMHQSDDNITAALMRNHSQNRILYGAFVPLPQPGQWRFQFEVIGNHSNVKIEHLVTIAPPASPVFTYWPLLILPFAVGGIIGLHQWRIQSRR